MFFFEKTIITLIMLFIFFMSITVAYGALKYSSVFWMNGVIEIIPIPCEKNYYQQNTTDGQTTWIEKKKESTGLCLPADEVVGLNNSIKLAESISLLAVFIAIVGLLLPILGFFSLKHQRENWEDAINKIEDKLEISRSEVEKANINAKDVKEFINNSRIQIDSLPISVLEAAKFRQEYLIHRFRMRSEELKKTDESSEISGALKLINTIFAAAYRLESVLQNFGFEDDHGVLQGFQMIQDHISREDVINNEPYILILKQILGRFYQAGVFNSDAKREALSEFLKNALKTEISQWLREVSAK